MFCPNCGKELPSAGKFCPSCGAPAPREPAAPVARQEAPAPAEKAKKKKGLPIITIILLVIIAAALGAGAFFVLRPRENAVSAVEARLAAWQSGDVRDLLGAELSEKSEAEKSREEMADYLLQNYGEFFEESPQAEDETPLFEILLKYSELELDAPSQDYPAEAELTLTVPDSAALLEELGYESYSDGDELRGDFIATLKKGLYETRTEVITVTLIERDGAVYAEESPEFVRAVYGGILEVYEEEYAAMLEELYADISERSES